MDILTGFHVILSNWRHSSSIWAFVVMLMGSTHWTIHALFILYIKVNKQITNFRIYMLMLIGSNTLVIRVLNSTVIAIISLNCISILRINARAYFSTHSNVSLQRLLVLHPRRKGVPRSKFHLCATLHTLVKSSFLSLSPLLSKLSDFKENWVVLIRIWQIFVKIFSLF